VRIRNPFRPRWQIMVRYPSMGPRAALPLANRFGRPLRFVLRSSAALVVAELTGPDRSQAYAPGVLHVVRLP